MDRLKCYVYGAGEEYNRLFSYLLLYREKIEILGIVTSYPQFFSCVDGFPCIRPDEMKRDQMDYVIIAIKNWKEVYDTLQEYGVEDEKILRSNIFFLPNFNLEDYLKLKKNKVSILANTCLGGRLYKALGMKVLSPTQNMCCLEKGNYLEFLNHYEYYLKLDMRESPGANQAYIPGTYNRESFMPTGIIDGKIKWLFPHSAASEDMVKKWNEKRKTMNYENVAALMIIQSDEDAIKFDELPIKKKLGFYYKELHLKSVLYCQEWENEEIRFQYDFNWIVYVHRIFLNRIDAVKFLNGEEDYLRCR